MQDRNLSPYAKAIYSYLRSYCGNNKECFPSIKKICFDLNMNKDTYYKRLNSLVGMGLIKVMHVKDNGKFARNIYSVSEIIGYDNAVYDNVVYEQTETNNNKINKNKNKKNNNTLYKRETRTSEFDDLTFEDIYEKP